MNAKKARAMIAIGADSRQLKSELATSKKMLRAFGADAKKIGGKMWGGGKGALGTIGAGLGLQASVGLTEIVQGIRDFEKGMLRFQVSAQKSNADMAIFRSELMDVSKATAVSREDVLAGADSYVKLTGDAQNAAEAMKLFARVAQASGSSTTDIAQSAAAMKLSGIAMEDMESAFSALIAQGRGGSVEIVDTAKHLAELMPMFRQFEGGAGMSGLRDLGAAFQVVMKGAGTASTAAAQFKGVMSALGNPQVVKKLKAIGVNVFSKTGKMRNYIELMKEIASNKRITAANIGDIFGDQQARTAILTTREQIAALGELRQAGEDTSAVQSDLNTVMANDAMKLEASINNVKLAIVAAFTPERIAAFVDVVEKVASAIGKTIDGLTELKDWSDGKDISRRNPFAVGGREGFGVGPAGAARASSEFQKERERQFLARHVGGPAGDAARGELARRAKFEEASAEIEAGGSKEERMKRAVRAMSGDDTSGSMGVMEAGRGHLVGVSEDEINRVRAQLQTETMKSLPIQLTQAFVRALEGANVTVKVDSSTVAKTVNNAPIHRGGGS